jgi:hypothetical protein
MDPTLALISHVTLFLLPLKLGSIETCAILTVLFWAKAARAWHISSCLFSGHALHASDAALYPNIYVVVKTFDDTSDGVSQREAALWFIVLDFGRV